MSTITSVEDIARETERLLDVGLRIDRHGESEMHPIAEEVHEIMASITPERELTWMNNLAWSAPLLEGSGQGNPKISMAKTWDSIIKHYQTQRLTQQMPPGSKRLPGTDIRTTWYGLFEVLQARALNTITSEEYTTDAVVLFAADGSTGISSEIGWVPLEEVDLAKTTRVDILTEYRDALRAADTDRLMQSMGDDVQGAVRAYFAYDEEFVLLDGRDATAAYFTKLFDAVEVINVEIINSVVREWYIFADLCLDVRVRADDSLIRFRTAEILGLGGDGRIVSRSGYGTPSWPISAC